MLAIQWSKADGYARACGAVVERLIDTLAPNDGPMTQAAATSLAAARQTDGGAELRYKAMMAGVDALVRAAAEDGAPAFRETLKQGVLAFSSRQSLRDQSWFAASGFDPRPDELLAVDDIIAETVRGERTSTKSNPASSKSLSKRKSTACLGPMRRAPSQK